MTLDLKPTRVAFSVHLAAVVYPGVSPGNGPEGSTKIDPDRGSAQAISTSNIKRL